MKRGDKTSIENWANRGMWDFDDDPGVFVPTAEQIAAMCREIQSGWSEEERLVRLGRIVPSRDPMYDRETGAVRNRQPKGPKPAGTPNKTSERHRQKAYIR